MATELPDFEDMQKAIDRMTALDLRKSILEYRIKLGEANVYRKATFEPEFFQKGKPLATTAIKSIYEFTGLKGELIDLRKELIQVEIDLNKEKYLYDLMKNRIEVWRSEQANQRVSLSV